jgi:hypothetical protein
MVFGWNGEKSEKDIVNRAEMDGRFSASSPGVGNTEGFDIRAFLRDMNQTGLSHTQYYVLFRRVCRKQRIV